MAKDARLLNKSPSTLLVSKLSRGSFSIFTASKRQVGLKVVNLQRYDVARKIILAQHAVADNLLRYLQCCNALEVFESDSKV